MAAMGTRCLSISVMRRSGGAAGRVRRRSGVAAGTGAGTLGSGLSSLMGPGGVRYSGPLMSPSLRMRQKWTARKMAATRGMRMTWRT